MIQSQPDFQADSPQIKRKIELTQNESYTLQTIIPINSSSPDKVLRQKIFQLSEGKSRPKFQGLSFQKCENFDEEVVDPNKIVRKSNNSIRLRQIFNGIFQIVIIIFNCLYTKNGYLFCNYFGFALALLSQWVLMDIHLDKLIIELIKKLQKKRITQSKSPRKKSAQKNSPRKSTQRKVPSKNSSLNHSKISNNLKAQQGVQKEIELNQIQNVKRESSLNILNLKLVEDNQHILDNSLNKNQSHSLNKQNNQSVQQNISYQHKRRTTSIMGISENQTLKQSGICSQQHTPKHMQENSKGAQILTKQDVKNEQMKKYEIRRAQNLHRKSTALINNDILSPLQQKPLHIKQQSSQEFTFLGVEKNQEQENSNINNNNSNRYVERQKPIKRKRDSLSTMNKSQRNKKIAKPQKKNEELEIIKKAGWCLLFRQFNYQWVQYIINLIPLIALQQKDQKVLRNLLLLQLLRGIFIIDALISYQQVELTHQYTQYTRKFLNLNPFKFVTLYLVLLIILSSFIYYVIEDLTTLWDSIWNIIVSITTIGYGDIVPQTQAGRFLIIIVANISVIFLSFITSFIQNMQEFQMDQQESFDKILSELKEKKIRKRSILVIKYYFKYHLPSCEEIITKLKNKKQLDQVKINNFQEQNDQLTLNLALEKVLDTIERKGSENQNKDEQADNIKNKQEQNLIQYKNEEQNKNINENCCVIQIQQDQNNINNQQNNKELKKKNKEQQQLKEQKQKFMIKIRKYLFEKKKQEHQFLNKAKQKFIEIYKQLKNSDINFYDFDNKILIKANINQMTQRKSILSEYSPPITENIIREYNNFGCLNFYSFQNQEEQNKIQKNFVEQVKAFENLNKQILQNIQEILDHHQNIAQQNEECNKSLEISSNNCRQNNKILNQNNSFIVETPKQIPINIPSNFKTMTFQAGTNASINTCETPVNNTRRAPQPFNSKLCIEDDSSNNLSRLQICKGDADNNTLESSDQINNLIIFNQSSEQVQSSINVTTIQNQIYKFSSCSDIERGSITPTQAKQNRNFNEELDEQKTQNKMLNNQRDAFKKRKQEEEDDYSENKSYFSKINQKMVNIQTEAGFYQQILNNQEKQQEQQFKQNNSCCQDSEFNQMQNLDSSDIFGNSLNIQNQISAPPSSLPLAKFIKRDQEQNQLGSEDCDVAFEEEEQQSNKTEAHSQNKKIDSSKKKWNHNSIIPGFTDNYLKSNPKFLQDVNFSNENKMPKITKIRQFSLDIPSFQQGENIFLFNNSQQNQAEENFQSEEI